MRGGGSGGSSGIDEVELCGSKEGLAGALDLVLGKRELRQLEVELALEGAGQLAAHLLTEAGEVVIGAVLLWLGSAFQVREGDFNEGDVSLLGGAGALLLLLNRQLAFPLEAPLFLDLRHLALRQFDGDIMRLLHMNVQRANPLVRLVAHIARVRSASSLLTYHLSECARGPSGARLSRTSSHRPRTRAASRHCGCGGGSSSCPVL